MALVVTIIDRKGILHVTGSFTYRKVECQFKLLHLQQLSDLCCDWMRGQTPHIVGWGHIDLATVTDNIHFVFSVIYIEIIPESLYMPNKYIHRWYIQWRSKQKCHSGQDPEMPPLLPQVPPPTYSLHGKQSPSLQNKFTSDPHCICNKV